MSKYHADTVACLDKSSVATPVCIVLSTLPHVYLINERGRYLWVKI